MGSYNINSWQVLTSVLDNIGETEYEIVLNFIGDFGSPDPDVEFSSFEIVIPSQVTKCTINGDVETAPNPIYNAHIIREPLIGNSALELV